MPIVRAIDVARHARRSPLNGRPSAARDRLREQALGLLREEQLLDASYSYRIVPLQATAGPVLHADGEQLEAPWLIPASGRLTALACCVCTLGAGLERRVTALFSQRRASLAIALDELGNELLFELSRRAQDRMLAQVTRSGLSMAGELRAGDPGLALQAQGAVLRLAEGERIGVRVGAGHLMHPLKSTSLVMGVGQDMPPATWSRCDSCRQRARCGVHQRAREAAASA